MDRESPDLDNPTRFKKETEVTTKSIIDPKYRNKYRGEKDWLSQLIDNQVARPVMKNRSTKNEDGSPGPTEVVATSKTRIDLDALFDLAAANGFDARAKYGDQADRKNAPGRLRMTIGNVLRAIAKRRHGLYVLVDGEKVWSGADASFIGDIVATETPDGEKIAKAAPANTEADAEAGAKTETAEA